MLKKIMRLSLCITVLLISACTTVSQNSGRDGPPVGPIDLSKIHDPVPRVLPLSRYGNNSYVVYGRRYYVRKTAAGYDERGMASWYGTKFHGHRASDGERYNMLAMTGAMRDLPIPTFVQVTNLQNNRKAVVEVNDRGPFKENRLIDLSYAAAAKLGVVGHGTAYVEVRAIDPRTWGKVESDAPRIEHYSANTQNTQSTPTQNYSGKGQLFLQIGAFKTMHSAENVLSRVHKVTREPARIAKISVRGLEVYRVQVGPLANADTTNIIHQRLVKSGFSKTMTVIE